MRAIVLCILLSGSAALPNLWAQNDRLAGSINPTNTVILQADSNSKARPEFDRGHVNAALHLDGIIFHFKPSASQQDALRELLQQQQNPASPNYRQWLQPEEFADRFGLSPGDLAKVVAWAQSQGLRVEYQGRMRTSIRLSGSAAQVESAFHVELHRYQVDGEMHFANAGDPSIPAALEPLLLAIRGLNDFYPKPPRRVSRQLPDFTSATGTHFLFPADLWTIYDMNPLMTAGLAGSGQKLVVVGQSNIDLTDVRSFPQADRTAGQRPANCHRREQPRDCRESNR